MSGLRGELVSGAKLDVGVGGLLLPLLSGGGASKLWRASVRQEAHRPECQCYGGRIRDVGGCRIGNDFAGCGETQAHRLKSVLPNLSLGKVLRWAPLQSI